MKNFVVGPWSLWVVALATTFDTAIRSGFRR